MMLNRSMSLSRRVERVILGTIALSAFASAASGEGLSPNDTTKTVVRETTKIEPDVVYRPAWLGRREDSVYAKEEYTDFVDQLYLTLRFSKSYGMAHDVVLEPTIRTQRERPNTTEVVIEQAYTRMAIGRSLMLTVGKKSEYEGSGFLMNPSDLLNENRDVFDPLYQREGKVFGRLTARTPMGALSVGAIPKRANGVRDGKAWFQYSADVLESEIKLQQTVHQTEKSTTGVSVSRFFGDRLELHYDGRYQSRQRNAEDVRERPFSSYRQNQASWVHLGGARYVMSGRRTVIVEGIQNQAGLLPGEVERYHAFIAAQTSDVMRDPDRHLIGRRYAALAYEDSDTIPQTRLTATILANVNDRSIFGVMAVKHTMSPLTSIEIAPAVYRGSPDTEFGEAPFHSVVQLMFNGRF